MAMSWFEIFVLTPVFIFVLVWTHASLGMSGIFSGFTRWVIAVCVAMLSAIGLLWGFRPGEVRVSAPPAVETRPLVQLVLLPYAALGLTLLIGILLLLLLTIRRKLNERIQRGDALRTRPDRPHEPACRD